MLCCTCLVQAIICVSHLVYYADPTQNEADLQSMARRGLPPSVGLAGMGGMYHQKAAVELHDDPEEGSSAVLAALVALHPRQVVTNEGHALWLFGPNNKVRLKIYQLVHHRSFEVCHLGPTLFV